MLKKTLSILSLVYGGLAVAGTMGPVCAPGNVTVPCEANQWEFGVQALYLETTHGRHVGVPAATAANLITSGDINSQWDWGFRLNGAYHFGTGSDVSIDWTHLTNDNDFGPFNGAYLQLTTALPILNPAVYGLTFDDRYDQVNIVMGQHVDMSERKHVRFYGGGQYARMNVNGAAVYTVTSPAFLPSIGGGVTDYVNTDFSGAGPVLGIDYAYDVVPGFSVTANTSGSMLMGTSRYNAATVYNNGLVVTSAYGNRWAVVPSLEAKLGANYAYNMAYGQLNLVGGYQVTNYFKALQARASVTDNIIVSSNYALSGPYFGVKWLGNA